LSEPPEAILENILRLMGFPAPVRREDREGETYLQIDSGEGILIGRQGKTLEALEWVIRVIVGGETAIRVDCGGYRERQKKQVEEMALQAIARVRQRRETVTLGPFLPAERKIIHQLVSKEKGMKTESEGEGWEKLVHIIPD
jgi:spoIIIJ-associated protein